MNKSRVQSHFAASRRVSFILASELNRPKSPAAELTYLCDRREREVTALLLTGLDRRLSLRNNLTHHACHAVRSMPLGPSNQLVQRFPELDLQVLLEKGRPLIDFGRHVVHCHSNAALAVEHLPEGRHHALVPRQGSMVNIDATERGESQELFFEDVRTGH